METELKFALVPDARAKIEQHARPLASDGEVHRDYTTYFDTPDQAWRKAGFSLRIRYRPESGGYRTRRASLVRHEIHELVLATSPNFYNITVPVALIECKVLQRRKALDSIAIGRSRVLPGRELVIQRGPDFGFFAGCGLNVHQRAG